MLALAGCEALGPRPAPPRPAPTTPSTPPSPERGDTRETTTRCRARQTAGRRIRGVEARRLARSSRVASGRSVIRLESVPRELPHTGQTRGVARRLHGRGEHAGSRPRHSAPLLRGELYPLPAHQCGRLRGGIDYGLLRASAQRQPQARRPLSFPRFRRARRPAGARLDRGLSATEGHAAAGAARRAACRALFRPLPDRAGTRGARRQGNRLGRRSDRSLLSPDPGLGADCARVGGNDPCRLRGTKRPPLPLDRTRTGRARRSAAREDLDARDQGMGSMPIPASSPNCSIRMEATYSSASSRPILQDRPARSASRSPRGAALPWTRAMCRWGRPYTSPLRGR